MSVGINPTKRIIGEANQDLKQARPIIVGFIAAEDDISYGKAALPHASLE